MINMEMPDVFDISGDQGRKSSYEVTLNGENIYSKLETKQHAEYDDLLEKIKDIVIKNQ